MPEGWSRGEVVEALGMSTRIGLQRKLRHAIQELLRFAASGHERDILHEARQTRPPLVGVQNSGERIARLLPLRRDLQEVLVLGEQKAADPRRTGEEGFVIPFRGPVFLARQDIDVPAPQAVGDARGMCTSM